MFPLLLVYLAEYTSKHVARILVGLDSDEFAVNQGVSPNLLFPIQSAPFDHYRDFYRKFSSNAAACECVLIRVA